MVGVVRDGSPTHVGFSEVRAESGRPGNLGGAAGEDLGATEVRIQVTNGGKVVLVDDSVTPAAQVPIVLVEASD